MVRQPSKRAVGVWGFRVQGWVSDRGYVGLHCMHFYSTRRHHDLFIALGIASETGNVMLPQSHISSDRVQKKEPYLSPQALLRLTTALLHGFQGLTKEPKWREYLPDAAAKYDAFKEMKRLGLL